MTNSFCSSSASLVSALSCRSGAEEPANSSVSSPDTPDTSLDNACIRECCERHTKHHKPSIEGVSVCATHIVYITHAWGVTKISQLNASAYCDKPGEMLIILH